MILGDINKNAVVYIKQKESINKIIKELILDTGVSSKEYPVTLFMAGSPGAGKTEFSKGFLKELGVPFARIDPDEIRGYLPGYTGSNSSEVQNAVSLGVEKLYDFVLKKKYDTLLDGTLASIEVARKNINRSLVKGRKVGIFYLFQPPDIAWEFTQKREKKEGRRITKDVFIFNFINAYKNVNILKEEFSRKIQIDFIEKDYKHNIVQFKVNIDKLDNYIDFDYNSESLGQLLKNSL